MCNGFIDLFLFYIIGLLLADEVTSGLDSHAAASIMDILLQMTKQGATVLTTIHQPSSQIYQKFDQLLLLSKGKCVYFGPASEAVDYFASCGFNSPPEYNPADYFLEIVANKENHQTLIDYFQRSECNSKLNQILQEQKKGTKESKTNQTQIVKPPNDDNDLLSDKIEIEEETIYDMNRINNAKQGKTCCMSSNKTPWIYQFLVLTHRNFIRLFKNPMFIGQMIVSYLLSALFMGALFSDLKTNTENQFTLCISFMLDVFGINAFFAVNAFIQDSSVFRREHYSGYYSTSAFYVSRTLSSMPVNLIVCTLYTFVLFYWIGLADKDLSKFPTLLILNYFTMEIFLALNEIFGVIFTTFETAVLFAGSANTVTVCYYLNLHYKTLIFHYF